jgi:Na+/H+-dicarboxylate symporter
MLKINLSLIKKHRMKEVLKNYSGILLTVGNHHWKHYWNCCSRYCYYIKPLGDIFLNLLFVSVVPLVFFAVSNSIASLEQQSKFGKIMVTMAFTFLFFILTAAVFTICAVYLFPVSGVSGSSEIVEEAR